jgi:hypothetical protein
MLALIGMAASTTAAHEMPGPGEVSAAALPAAKGVDAVSAERQVWVISSRAACGIVPGSGPRLSAWRYDRAAGRWAGSDVDSFLASGSPDVPTVFFVHGYRISHNEAFRTGWMAFQRFSAQVPSDQPLRFVVWSWPSAQVQGILADMRSKACQCDLHAYYLAWLLDRIDPREPVSLIGYSLGSRLIAGALHLLGGGRLAGRSLTQRANPARPPMRAVLMAGALDAHSFAPHGRNGRALAAVKQMLVMVNPADYVLRFYGLLYGLGGGPDAVGYVGAAGADDRKLKHWNVSRYVGEEHGCESYLFHPAIMAGLKNYILAP